MSNYDHLSHPECVQRLRAITDQMDAVTLGDDDAFNRLDGEFSAVDAQRLKLERRAALSTGDYRTERGSAGGTDWDDNDGTLGARTGRGHRAVAQAVRSGLLPDRAAEVVTGLLETGNATQKGYAATWARTAGDPAYLTAFQHLVRDPQRGHLSWTREETAAFAAVEEFRAMSTVDAAGGFMLPLVLDPSILLTSNGSISDMRRYSRVVTTTSDTWNGVTSAGVTARWHAEAAEVEDDSPTLAQPSIPVHRGDAFIPFSFEVGMDAPNFVQEMTTLLVDGADRLQDVAYVTGTGSGQPEGLITGLIAAGTSTVASVGTEALVSADVYNLQAALPPRFQRNARWMAGLATLNKISAFESTAGARLFGEGVDAVNGTLLRKPIHELSVLDSTINPAATESNYALVYGDFAAGMVIVDRVGTSVELVPHLFGPARRYPTGQRGLLMWFRTGSKCVIPNAFRVLNIATTA